MLPGKQWQMIETASIATRQCLPDESKAVVRYTRHPLDTDEVCEHIAKGKLPTRLALTWNDRVSFVLTEGLQLKKVAVLDVVLEAAASLASDGKDDNFDADVAIATGELQKLIPEQATKPPKLKLLITTEGDTSHGSRSSPISPRRYPA